MTVNFSRPEFRQLTERSPKLLEFQVTIIDGKSVKPNNKDDKVHSRFKKDSFLFQAREKTKLPTLYFNYGYR